MPVRCPQLASEVSFLRSLDDELERCKPWIEAALNEGIGAFEFEDIADAIREGRMQLWPASRAMVVTEIDAYPRKKVLNGFLAGGDLEQITDMMESIAAWGAEQGCDLALTQGREGWARVFGWDRAGTILMRSL